MKQKPKKLTSLIAQWLKTKHDGLSISVDYGHDDILRICYWDVIWVHDYGRVVIYYNNNEILVVNLASESDVCRPEDPELFNKITKVLKLSKRCI